MDFAERIAALAERIKDQRDTVQTEEACKTAFVMPFISALGYDVFDPRVVVPEFTADVGTKKGEKVDYAIFHDGNVIMLIECKLCDTSPNSKNTSQLYRYFSVTDARFSILTNGIQYWFYSDLEQANKMDARPFFEFNLLDYRAGSLEELRKFASSNFNVDAILATANTLKYTNAVAQEIVKEIENPSEDMVRLLVSRVFDGRFTQSVKEEFTPIVGRAFRETLREMINDRLSSALDPGNSDADVLPDDEPTDSDVVTTEEEVEAYQIVRAIVREVIQPDRIVMRDAKSYCAILIDDNNRRPLARLHFNSKSVRYVGLFDEDKREERIGINSLNDIFSLAGRLKDTARLYSDGESA